MPPKRILALHLPQLKQIVLQPHRKLRLAQRALVRFPERCIQKARRPPASPRTAPTPPRSIGAGEQVVFNVREESPEGPGVLEIVADDDEVLAQRDVEDDVDISGWGVRIYKKDGNYSVSARLTVDGDSVTLGNVNLRVITVEVTAVSVDSHVVAEHDDDHS